MLTTHGIPAGAGSTCSAPRTRTSCSFTGAAGLVLSQAALQRCRASLIVPVCTTVTCLFTAVLRHRGVRRAAAGGSAAAARCGWAARPLAVSVLLPCPATTRPIPEPPTGTTGVDPMKPDDPLLKILACPLDKGPLTLLVPARTSSTTPGCAAAIRSSTASPSSCPPPGNRSPTTSTSSALRRLADRERAGRDPRRAAGAPAARPAGRRRWRPGSIRASNRSCGRLADFCPPRRHGRRRRRLVRPVDAAAGPARRPGGDPRTGPPPGPAARRGHSRRTSEVVQAAATDRTGRATPLAAAGRPRRPRGLLARPPGACTPRRSTCPASPWTPSALAASPSSRSTWTARAGGAARRRTHRATATARHCSSSWRPASSRSRPSLTGRPRHGYRGWVLPHDRWLPLAAFDLAAHQSRTCHVAEHGLLRRSLAPHRRYVNSVLFLPDGERPGRAAARTVHHHVPHGPLRGQ